MTDRELILIDRLIKLENDIKYRDYLIKCLEIEIKGVKNRPKSSLSCSN